MHWHLTPEFASELLTFVVGLLAHHRSMSGKLDDLNKAVEDLTGRIEGATRRLDHLEARVDLIMIVKQTRSEDNGK